MSKHTKGPWHAVRTPESPYFDWYVRGKRFSVGLDHEADARLISAAPELLAALQCCIGSLSVVSPGGDEDPDVQRAKKAVAKALGED